MIHVNQVRRYSLALNTWEELPTIPYHDDETVDFYIDAACSLGDSVYGFGVHVDEEEMMYKNKIYVLRNAGASISS